MIFSQITSVSYQLRYEESTDVYECYLIVNSGSAMSVIHRTQLNSQYSIICPTGSSLTIEEQFMPLIDNQTYTGTVPSDWIISATATGPSGAPESDFYIIIPDLSSTSLYNDIMAGDTIKLFNFIVSDITACSDVVMIYENGPPIAGTNLDLNNGFSLGAVPSQLYLDNIPSENIPISVDIPVVEIIGDEVICIGITTQLSPTTDGIWESSDESVATVTNTGVVMGVGQGVASFTYTSSTTGCSAITDPITINPKPTVGFLGIDVLCVLSTTNLLPSSGGVWYNIDPSIASINSMATVTALVPGFARFVFTDDFGCTSDTLVIEVLDIPEIGGIEEDSVCVYSEAQLSPEIGGTWVSSDPLVATITNAGLVTYMSAGVVYFVFTDSNDCNALPSEVVTVFAKPMVTLLGPDEIFIGQTTDLSPLTNGVWTSSNEAVLTVSNDGVATGIQLGVASVVFVETDGCMSVPIEIEVIDNNCINPNAVAVSVSSNNATDGSVTCMPAGGVEPYNYLWSDGSTTPSIEGLASGTFSVIVNGAEGCVGYDTVTIAYCPLMTAEIEVENTSCFAVCDGTINIINVSGGTAPYQYMWNNALTSSSISGLCAGNYSVTISDANGCLLDTSEFIIHQPPLLLVNAEANTTSAIAIPSGGTAPYSFAWSNGETTASIFDLVPGYYSITVTDANGCEGVETVITDISFSIDSLFHITEDHLGAIYISLYNSSNTSYSWIGPNNYTSDEEDIIDLEDGGCYTVTMLDIDLQISKDTTVCIDDLTAIHNLNGLNYNISTYPNPTNGIWNIAFDDKNVKNTRISIYDLTGKLLENKLYTVYNNKISMNMNYFNSGVYIVKINIDNKSYYHKVILIK